jgi:hypothetical protein
LKFGEYTADQIHLRYLQLIGVAVLNWSVEEARNSRFEKLLEASAAGQLLFFVCAYFNANPRNIVYMEDYFHNWKYTKWKKIQIHKKGMDSVDYELFLAEEFADFLLTKFQLSTQGDLDKIPFGLKLKQVRTFHKTLFNAFRHFLPNIEEIK